MTSSPATATGTPAAPRAARRRAVRLGAGIAVAALFAAAIPAAAFVPWPSFTREPVSITALPEPTAALLSCTGPILAVGRDATAAGQLTDAAPQEIDAATGEGQSDATVGRLAATDVSGGAGPDALRAEPSGGQRTDLAAAGSATASDADLAGFAASSCAPPLMESWLVGGSGATGAADLVLIANPSGVAAEVSLTVYGADGPVQPAAALGIIVPPRTQRVLPLASLALGEESPVVRINATGAPVQAALQTSLTRTLLPGGVDQVGTTAAPSETQVIPSFTVAVAPGEAGASEPASVLRVLAPSDDASATVEITPVDGGAPVREEVELPAGVPSELELGSLAPGAYRVSVSASGPVVTAMWATTGFGEGADFAWHTAPSPLSVPSLVAVASGPSPVLSISNEGADEANVELEGPSGGVQLVVPAGGVVRTPVDDAAVYSIDARGGRVRANVTYSGPSALAGYDVLPADAAAEPVVVYPQ